MPIDFPNNPIAGQTYAYGDQKWQFNGVAWDKLFIADDANALYGISGSIYASSLATGLLYGGILSINAGNSAQFDITAGRGQIHAAGSTYTANPQPTLQYVTWAGQTGITLTYLATNDTTWIYIDSAGNLQQRTEYYTDDQLEENIIIGQLVHPSRTFINLARTNPNVAYATDKQYEQFIRSFGPIKVSGHTIQPNGANLKLNRTSGTAFSLGRNWINDTDNPSVVSDGAYNDCIFYRYYRGATAGTFITVPNQTEIDPTNYDDGSGTLQTVPGGKYTIQRLFYYPNTPTLLGVYYGRAQYTSLADAAANINFENFTEIENTKTNAIFVAYLLIKSGCTDITNTSDALILQAGNFRSTTSGGGSVSLTLDDLTDVIITSPQNYQVLTYVDGVTGWENYSLTSLPLVSSIRGLTGAVGITNGSGIGLSVSGQTMTFSNTGVLSIDGGTGAITNVARTNVTNAFSANQSISTNTSPALYVEETATANSLAIDPYTLSIIAYTDAVGLQQALQFSASGTNSTLTLPEVTTQIAGLAVNQTFTGTNVFNTLTNFPGGISAAGATFSSLVRFSAGISAAGGTFSGDIAVNGGDITTTSTSTSLFNANATTLDILNTQSSGFTLNIGSATTYSGTKNINIGGNVGGGAGENVRIGSASSASKISILGGITLGAVGGTTVRVASPSEFVVESTSTVNGVATFNGRATFNAGISASGGVTFNSNVTVNTSNILNAGSIQTDKAAMEIDTARAASRVAIGDFNGLGNGNYIYIRNATNELDIVNGYGFIQLGDVNGIDTGNYIYYYPEENRLSSDTNSNITGFNQIYATTGFYETPNEIRVTNNARSWFL